MKSFVLAGIATAALTLPAAAGGIYLNAELLKDGPMRLPLPYPLQGSLMNLYLRIYLAGYSGRVMPRWLRRLAARSKLHRAWLCGFNGCFEQDGVRYGPANPYPGPVLRDA